jgi:hypothetical protein
MLVVALGVLTLLSLLAVTFVTIMNLEKVAAANYVDQLRSQMTAEAGIERMLTAIKRAATEPLFKNGRLQPFVFGVDPANPKEIDVTVAVDDVDPVRSPYFYGYTGRTHPGSGSIDWNDADSILGLDEYRVKVLDTSALLDLNYPLDLEQTSGSVSTPVRGQVLELMLTALGEAIARVRNSVPDPVRNARFTGPGGSYMGAQAILAYRASQPNFQFTSKSQLREILDEADYRVLRDYVTVHSWIDRKAVSPTPTDGHHSVRIQPRPQINLNLAPREVLTAMLAPIAGRRYVYMVDRDQPQFIEEDNDQNYNRPSGFDLKEDTRFAVREGWVYVGPVGVQDAEGIANWIIANRPWKGMADLHHRLMVEMRRPTGALDGFLPKPDTNEAKIFQPTPPPGADTVTFRARRNLSGIHGRGWFPAWVREAGYSLLMANLNPAFTSNSLNPNTAARLPIDKGSLLYPADLSAPNPEGVTYPRQTFDACFESRGVYEITSLGQIIGPKGSILAQERIRSVVRLFDMAVHRAQADFESNGLTYAFPERADTVSWPETRSFHAGAAAQDDLPHNLTSSNFGHLEVLPQVRYDAGSPVNVPGGLTSANLGSPLLGLFFERPIPDLNPGAYLHADYAAGQDVLQPPAPAVIGGRDARVFARARGTAAEFSMGNPRVTPQVPVGGTWHVMSPWQSYQNPGTGTLLNDGYYASYRQHRDRSLWYRAGAGEDVDSEQGAMDAGVGNVPDEQSDANVFYRKGGIEFWYKPDFDWAYGPPGNELPTPLVCGYLFSSRVWYNHGNPGSNPPALIQPATPSDGTQLYLMRNSEGQLRATRMYFRVVGDPQQPSDEIPDKFVDPIPGDGYGDDAWFTKGALVNPSPSAPAGYVVGAIERYREGAERDPVDDPTKQPPDGYIWPPQEFKVVDDQINRARTDAFVKFEELKHWRAGEWHHIAVYWDDSSGNKETALRIYVDGRKLSVAHGLPENTTDNPNAFVRLNEPANFQRDGEKQFPRDHLFVAGIERNIARLGEGVFKHENTVENQVVGGTAVARGVDRDKVTLFACGTIDDLITYDGAASPPRSISRSNLKRFQRRGEYVNHFDLRSFFPRGGEPLELARLHWTALLPIQHGQAVSTTGGEGEVDVRVTSEPAGVAMQRPSEGQQASGTVPNVRYGDMRDWSYVALVESGNPAQAARVWPPSDEAGPWPKIRYELKLTPANFPVPGGVLPQVDTPVVQEVGLSWYLPTAEVLLKERVVE